MAAIGNLSLNISVNVAGLTSGLKGASNAVDKFYAGIGNKIRTASSPLTNAVKQVRDMGAAFGDLSKSVVAPLAFVKTSVEGIGKGLEGAGRAAKAVIGPLKAMGAAIAATGLAAVAGLAAFATGGINRIDELTDAAARIGVTTEALSALRYAADLSGSSATDLDAALEKLNVNLGDSLVADNAATKALNRLGLTARDLAKMSPDQALENIIKGFEGIPDAASRASAAVDIFGKGGVRLANTLSVGSTELARLKAEAKSFGVVVSQVDAAKIGLAKDAIDKIMKAVEGLSNTIAIKLSPYITVVADKISTWFVGILDQGKLVDRFVDGVISGIGLIIDTAGYLKIGFQNAIAEIAKQLSILVGNLGRVVGGLPRALISKEDAKASQKALFDVSSTLAGYSVNMTRTADKAKRMWDLLSPGQTFIKMLSGVKGMFNEVAVAAGKAATDATKGSQTNSLATSIDDVTTKLEEQIATFGKSSAAVEVWKLKQAGASEEQITNVKRLGDQLQKLQDTAQIKEALKSPENKFKEQVEKLREAFETGGISMKQFQVGKAMAARDSGLSVPPRLAGATDRRSSEGRSVILAARIGNRGEDAVAKNTSDSVRQQMITNKKLDEMSKGLREIPKINTDVAVV